MNGQRLLKVIECSFCEAEQVGAFLDGLGPLLNEEGFSIIRNLGLTNDEDLAFPIGLCMAHVVLTSQNSGACEFAKEFLEFLGGSFEWKSMSSPSGVEDVEPYVVFEIHDDLNRFRLLSLPQIFCVLSFFDWVRFESGFVGKSLLLESILNVAERRWVGLLIKRSSTSLD